MNKWPNNEKGFTFIEITIVIVILGILVSIAYPSFARVKAKWDLEMAARFLVSDIRQWEYQAIAEQKAFRMILNGETKIYRFQEGTQIKKKRDLSQLIANIYHTEGLNDFNLLPSGATSRAGHFTLISTYNDIKYVYVLNTTGRVRASDSLIIP